MTGPVKAVFYTGFAIIFLGILSPLFFEYLKPKRELPLLYPAPKFELEDSRGRNFNSASLKNKIWVANFFFTSCPGPCPMQHAALKRVQDAYAGDPLIHFVSISVDPERDDAEALSDYAERFDANLSVWHFLRGPMEEIDQIMTDGFKLGSLGTPDSHSTRFVLVDGDSMIRGYYNPLEEESLALLKSDIMVLRRGNLR